MLLLPLFLLISCLLQDFFFFCPLLRRRDFWRLDLQAQLFLCLAIVVQVDFIKFPNKTDTSVHWVKVACLL